MLSHFFILNRATRLRQPEGFPLATIVTAICALASQPVQAQTAIWTGPTGGSWFTPANWNTGQVPGATTAVSIQNGSPAINASGTQFASLSITGTSIVSVNNSNIGTAGSINLVGAGPATGLNALTGISLTGSSSAGNASMSATGSGLSRFLDAIVAFHDTSTAANATLTTGGQAQFAFFDTSSAGHATINNNAGGLTAFQDQASAGGAHITNNAEALTVFVGSATADNATIVNNAGGVVDLSQITSAIGIGSLSGSGNVYLGGARLTLGNLGQNDVIGGVVTDGVSPDLAAYAAQRGLILSSPAGGSLAKVGTGTLTLTGRNTYTGGTSFDGGVVQIGADANLGASTGTLTFDGGALSATADIAMNRATTINAGGGTIDTAAGTQLTQGGVIGGSGMLTKTGGGRMLLNAANTYTGGTTVVSGTLVVGDAAHSNATIGSGATTVSPGTTLGGYGSALGSANNGGTIEVANALPTFASGNTGSFSIAGDLNNSGLANVAAASGQIGNVLNVGANYAGSNGQLALNTLLNEGGAATHSDQLVVGGNASGQTAIKVNGSGTGAYTPGDGILLVQVNGTSAAGSFHLAGPVQGGAYQYLLYQGSASSANDWYLRSQLEAQPAPATPPETVPPSIPTPAQPAYRPGVVGYSLTPLLNVDYGYSILSRLHERAGDIVNLESAQPGNRNGIWGRIGGENFDANAGNRFSTNANTFFAQFGKDWTLSRNANGASTHAGATLTFGSMSASFDDSLRSINGQLTNPTGTVQTQAQSIGGYWTKYRADGAYFDGVGQLTHYGNRYGDVYGGSASQNGFAAGVAGEVGKPYLIGSTRIAVEPQAQLLYQYVHLNSIDDNISAIGSTSTNALRGRLGARIFTANLSNETKTSSATPYLTVNVLHDFLSPGQTAVGGTPFASQFGKTWWDVGVGVTGSMGKHSELYVNVKYARAIGSYYGRAVFGQGGYRYSW